MSNGASLPRGLAHRSIDARKPELMTASPFANQPAMIGMIHVGALPGTPHAEKSLKELVSDAVREAVIYRDAQVDGVILENMHDRPYLKGHDVGPEVVATMTRIAAEVRSILTCPCGIQVLAGANEAAIAVALAANFDFVRVEGFVYGHIADEGWIDACAGDLLRYRRRIGSEAEAIAIWADIKKKHSAHAVTSDVSLADTAQAATYNLCDALIISGSHTAAATDPNDLRAVRTITPETPVYIGSGITLENVSDYRDASGFIVGSAVKENGHWENPLCQDRVEAIVKAVRAL